jgi:sigma-B regulation protein RsbU (phosphoserine phosphatase)
VIRAFIVDDEEPARERLRRLLTDVGGSGACRSGTGLEIVGEASDGSDALPKIAELAPDLVFLDIQMPGLSGLDVAAQLQAPRPRIVFCTAFDQFAIDAFEHHAVDYLLKPVNSDRLARTVERVSEEIDEQRRLAHELSEAERTQARLMPASEPSLAGLDCAGTCRPARGLGGDYYDFLTLGSARVGMAVGDVSGKGTYAGLLVAALQARMQALVARGIHEPARLLGELNALTLGTMEGHRFATVAFAAYDPRARRLTYASAGHPPGIVVRQDGTTCELASTGPAIGWIADARFTEISLDIRPGDVLALCSDGVTDTSAPSGKCFGSDGLLEAVRQASTTPAAGVVNAVMAELDRFSEGAPADDDRTLVIARVL